MLRLVLFPAVFAILSFGAVAGYAAGEEGLAPPAEIVRPNEPRSIVVKNGHFYLGDKRARFWGYNLQAGYFPDYQSIRNIASRLSLLGVNAIRLWPVRGTFYDEASFRSGRFVKSQRGDNSLLDRYDFMIAELKRNGIFVQNTALYYIDGDKLPFWPDPEIHSIFGDTPTPERIRKLGGVAPYLSPAFERLQASHIKNYLSHVNPYTGKTYAEETVFAGWELTNENKFIPCMFSAQCIKELPPALLDQLKHLWSKWQDDQGEGANKSETLPPFEDGWNKSNLPRHEQYRKFVVSRFVATSKRLEHVARSQAPSGQGIAVQPIAFNTHDQNLLSAHVADSAGDFVAIGAYQTPLTRDSSAQYFPWDPFLKRGPILHNFNYGAVEGKPLLVYETSFFSPYPYRSEWAFVMLGLAASQDWDAVYLYAYGQPNIIYRGDGGNQGYGQSPLPIPISMDSRSGRNYTFGFHHGGDEILVAAWMLGGWGFVGGGLLPSMKTVKYRFGAGNLYGLPPGYCSSASGCAQGSKPVIHEMNNASLQAKLRISFDENLTHGKTCNPCEFSNPSAQIQVTDSIVWDTKNSRAIFDSPRFKAVGGQLEGKVNFKGGINVTFNRPVFGSFGLYAADGRALEESLDIRIVAAGSSQNTDFRFSPAKVNFDLPYGAIAGVLDPGRAPIQITRPDLNTVLPGKKGKLSRYNFALEKYAHSEFDGQMAISSTEPFFFGRIER